MNLDDVTCSTCSMKRVKTDGHCYMFKEAPIELYCMQHDVYKDVYKLMPDALKKVLLATAINSVT